MLLLPAGGFASLTRIIASQIHCGGGCIRTNTRVSGLAVRDGRVTGLIIGNEVLNADAVIATPALPIIADIVEPHVTAEYLRQLRAINYLANVCLVLELDRSLSETYWLNVNDPSFPFVGIVEHTNFQPVKAYNGRHIAHLSKYLPATDPFHKMGADVSVRVCPAAHSADVSLLRPVLGLRLSCLECALQSTGYRSQLHSLDPEYAFAH